MLGPRTNEAASPQLDTAAMMSSRSENHRFTNKTDRPVCEYCNKLGHVTAKCWKLHGKPADYQQHPQRSKGSKSSYQVSQVPQAGSNTGAPHPSSEQTFFSKENLEQLYQLWSSHQLSNNPSSSLAQKGNFRTALSVSTKNLNPQILDSGASDHMTGSSYLLNSYFPCSGHEKV